MDKACILSHFSVFHTKHQVLDDWLQFYQRNILDFCFPVTFGEISWKPLTSVSHVSGSTIDTYRRSKKQIHPQRPPLLRTTNQVFSTILAKAGILAPFVDMAFARVAYGVVDGRCDL